MAESFGDEDIVVEAILNDDHNKDGEEKEKIKESDSEVETDLAHEATKDAEDDDKVEDDKTTEDRKEKKGSHDEYLTRRWWWDDELERVRLLKLVGAVPIDEAKEQEEKEKKEREDATRREKDDTEKKEESDSEKSDEEKQKQRKEKEKSKEEKKSKKSGPPGRPPWNRSSATTRARPAPPLYVYCLDVVLRKLEQLKQLKNIDRIFYAIKANPNPAILREICAAGVGFECVSIDELRFVRRLFPRLALDRFLFTPNFAPKEEYEEAFGLTSYVTLDNTWPLTQWPDLFKGRRIFLRIDPGEGLGHHSHVQTGGDHSKFGITSDQMEGILDIIKSLNITVIGLHVHKGSGIHDTTAWSKSAKLLLEYRQHFPGLKYLDLGGGLAIPYKPDEKPLNLKALNASLDELKKTLPDVELWLEPGRFIVADSGVMLTKVTQIKEKPNKRYIGVNAGMNALIRPSLYGSYHHIINLSRRKGDEEQDAAVPQDLCDVVGPICESGDFLGRDRYLPKKTTEGDVILIACVGAYGRSMASYYNMREPPQEIMIWHADVLTAAQRRPSQPSRTTTPIVPAVATAAVDVGLGGGIPSVPAVIPPFAFPRLGGSQRGLRDIRDIRLPAIRDVRDIRFRGDIRDRPFRGQYQPVRDLRAQMIPRDIRDDPTWIAAAGRGGIRPGRTGRVEDDIRSSRIIEYGGGGSGGSRRSKRSRSKERHSSGYEKEVVYGDADDYYRVHKDEEYEDSTSSSSRRHKHKKSSRDKDRKHREKSRSRDKTEEYYDEDRSKKKKKKRSSYS